MNDKLRQAQAEVENARQAVKQEQQKVYDSKAEAAGGKAEYRRQLAAEQFGTTDDFERAGYIQPDGRMLDRKKNRSVPESIAKQVLAVAQIANDITHNKEMLGKMRKPGAAIISKALDFMARPVYSIEQ